MKLTKKPLMFAAAVMGAAASSLAFAPHAGAAPITVPDYSFETNPGGVGDVASGTGWTGIDGEEMTATSPSGSYSGFVYGPGTSMTSAAALTTIAANTTYTLTVYASGFDNKPYGGNNGGLADVELLSNGTAIGGTASKLAFSSVDSYGLVTVTFDSASNIALNGTALTVLLGVDSASTHPYSVESFDDVTLTSTADAVPEPSTIALMLGGIGALALVRRMRRTA